MIDDDDLEVLIEEFLAREAVCYPIWAEKPKAANLADAIEIAALSHDHKGKKHSHQWKIPPSVLDRLRQVLLQDMDSIGSSPDFAALHERVNHHCNSIKGAGELVAYDVAFRIGLYLGFEPELVYLHAGTRIGARKLGVRGKAARLSVFPRPLRKLTPAQAGDFLCIYADRL